MSKDFGVRYQLDPCPVGRIELMLHQDRQFAIAKFLLFQAFRPKDWGQDDWEHGDRIPLEDFQITVDGCRFIVNGRELYCRLTPATREECVHQERSNKDGESS